MTAMTSQIDGDYDRGPTLLAVFWTEIAISTIFVFLRFYTRIRMGRVGADDWTILATLVMYIVTLSLCTVLVHYGLGRHVWYIPKEDQLEIVRWNWIVQPFGILTLPIGKISVVLLLERLMGRTSVWHRWFLWVNMALFTSSTVASSILSFAQCSPPRALWSVVPGATCLDPSIQANFATFTCAYSSFLDFVLALIPITFVRNLNMSIQKKIGLCMLLGMGVLSGICAAIKTAQSNELGIREDVSWALFSLYAWSSSEIFLNIVCACIPTLKPLYDYFAKSKPLRRDELDSHTASKNSGYHGFRLLKVPKILNNGSNTDRSAVETLVSTNSSAHENDRQAENHPKGQYSFPMQSESYTRLTPV